MEREDKIKSLGAQIQKRIDELKKMNCLIDMCSSTLSIYDEEITPSKIGSDYFGWEDDSNNQIVFTFDIARLSKLKTKNK